MTSAVLLQMPRITETISDTDVPVRAAYTMHDPIYIDGNADLLKDNSSTGISWGSGTAYDPYIIEGWDIDVSSANGIEIRNTSAHLTIMNCYVHDSGVAGSGIYLYGCVNGIVKENTCSSNDFGIHLSSSSDVTLSNNNCSSNNHYGIRLNFSSDNTLNNNTCSNNGCGIYLSSSSDNNTLINNTCSSNNYHGITDYLSSDNNTLVSNTCSSNNYVGIDFHSSSDNTLANNNCSSNNYAGIRLTFFSDSTLSSNNCSDNGCGIELHVSSDNTLVNNNCSSNNDAGIYLFQTCDDNTLSNSNCSDNDYGILLARQNDNNTLINNNFRSNDYGVYLVNSTRIAIYHNNFFGSIIDHAYDNRGSENFWNSDYPIGGNYWDNYTGVDEFSGSNQNQPGSDGIGDTPFFIDANSTDNYPFMEPVNMPPIASFTVSPSTGYVTTVFSVDSSSSSDAEDNLSVLEVRWDWESDGVWDTSWSTVKTDTHQYSVEGAHTISLEVKDTKGLSDNTKRQVTVVPDDVQPVADAGPDQIADEDTLVSFDGSGSSDNVDIDNYTWIFTDGTAKTSYGVSPTYVFETPGTYTVTLNVTDAAGNWDTDEVTINVNDVTIPSANAGPDQTVDEGSLVTFDGSNSSDNVDIVNYTWTFTYEGYTIDLYGETPAFRFGRAGVYTVTLTVKDAAGLTETDVVEITVEEKAGISMLAIGTIGIIVAIVALAVFMMIRKKKPPHET